VSSSYSRQPWLGVSGPLFVLPVAAVLAFAGRAHGIRNLTHRETNINNPLLPTCGCLPQLESD
jgi:hypothetical protein